MTLLNTAAIGPTPQTVWPATGYADGSKRLLDIALALLLLPVAALLIAPLYLLVRLQGGPGFYPHERIGRDGTPFACWKIRTMVPGAEARLAAMLSHPSARAEWTRSHKLRHDPRVTRLGRWLRATSLDELPQLWNVLRGEMSLVGPRPVTASELDDYGAGRAAYLSLRPGITGLWQVSGRNRLSFDARVALDMAYRDRVSLGTDLGILLRTLREVITRSGQ